MDRLAALDIFVRVVDTGSFSAVARQLRVGQPAISKAVVQLERWLDVALLLRSTRKVVPTEAGRSFYEHAKRTVEDAEEGVRAARGTSTTLAGKLRVSTSPCFGRIHVVPHLPAFLAQHPELSIDLVLDDRVIDLVEEGIDLALRGGAQADSSMSARKIADGKRVVVATPAYWKRRGIPRTPAELAAHDAIVLERRESGTTWTFQQGAHAVPVTLRGRLKVTATEGMRAAVLADMGFAVASAWSFTPELEAGTVRAVLPAWSLPTHALSAVFPAGRRASVKARTFLSFLTERFVF